MSEKREIKIEKTARYFTHGSDITKAKRVWFVLHGYGQLAEYFIRSFRHLNPSENFVIAPEGIHRFYLEGFSGRVGASWMTKEERLDDIDDYVKYLDQLYDAQQISSNSEIILLGFSQGVATAMRWLALGKSSRFNRAILWAGSFPHDLKPQKATTALQNLKVHCVIGNKDPFLNEEHIQRTKDHLAELKAEAHWYEYNGDHRIPKEALNAVLIEFK
ncbi:dienelactone hydrolase family protein [Cryomorphaceae bacterium 1068]|nr:dienelactone hydrolase family protein [Cryomorphaceae bacterium 1068]